MGLSHLARLRNLTAIVVAVAIQTFGVGEEDRLPSLAIQRTEDGTEFGLFGDKPAAPAATLIVFAVGLQDMESNRIYSDTGRFLAPHGWITVAIDPPCHGADRREGEPAGLDGWADRLKRGEDLMGPFTDRARRVLDFLIRERYTDPQRIAVSGTSRGGFCALHFAAVEPRVATVSCVSPVTDPAILREFSGIDEPTIRPTTISSIASRLTDPAILITIGNDDARVGTPACIAAAHSIINSHRARQSADTPNATRPPDTLIPVELIVAPSPGHRAIDNAYELAAKFILRRGREKTEERSEK